MLKLFHDPNNFKVSIQTAIYLIKIYKNVKNVRV